MIALIIVLATALVLALTYVVVHYVLPAYSRFRGSRRITCPETNSSAVVEVDAEHATLTTLAGTPHLRLEHCSRWPLREQCGQECLTQLDVAPPDCLVRSVLMKWYNGKKCVYCGKRFDEVHWLDHKPALLSGEGSLVEWNKVALADIDRTMHSHMAVCWDCFVAQSFLHEHSDLVTYRPWREGFSAVDRDRVE